MQQGDPLSPLLFILVEDILSQLLKKEFLACKIEAFAHPRGVPFISHLLYADDIVLFTSGNLRSLRNILSIFHTYETWSGHVVSVRGVKSC